MTQPPNSAVTTTQLQLKSFHVQHQKLVLCAVRKCDICPLEKYVLYCWVTMLQNCCRWVARAGLDTVIHCGTYDQHNSSELFHGSHKIVTNFTQTSSPDGKCNYFFLQALKSGYKCCICEERVKDTVSGYSPPAFEDEGGVQCPATPLLTWAIWAPKPVARVGPSNAIPILSTEPKKLHTGTTQPC